MLKRVRTAVYGALTSSTGNRLLPVRLAKSAVLYVNDVTGRPLASQDELDEREAFEARMAQRAQAGSAGAAASAAPGREAAPVVVFHQDRHHRELDKLRLILDARAIPYQVRNLEGDEAARAATLRDARGYELPVVFIAGTAVGGVEEVANLDNRGELMAMVFQSA